jgi:hypothetical protein
MQQLSGHHVHSRLSTHLPCIHQCMHTFTHTDSSASQVSWLHFWSSEHNMVGRLPLEFHTCMRALPICETHANELMSAYCHSSCQWVFGSECLSWSEIGVHLCHYWYETIYTMALQACVSSVFSIKLRKNVCLHVCWWVHLQWVPYGVVQSAELGAQGFPLCQSFKIRHYSSSHSSISLPPGWPFRLHPQQQPPYWSTQPLVLIGCRLPPDLEHLGEITLRSGLISKIRIHNHMKHYEIYLMGSGSSHPWPNISLSSCPVGSV